MRTPEGNTWQSVREKVQRRIRDRTWKPGDAIPNEADLAQEFGCARVTVNRALRDLAEKGLLERKRRSGTRVARHPSGRAVLDIPLIRKEIDALGKDYGYRLIRGAPEPAPLSAAISMSLPKDAPLVHITALHLADKVPYVLEDRWINIAAAPRVTEVDFTSQSPNEWLLENVPFTRNELTIMAVNAGTQDAEILDIAPHTALLEHQRTTWNEDISVTTVRLLYMPGHRLSSLTVE